MTQLAQNVTVVKWRMGVAGLVMLLKLKGGNFKISAKSNNTWQYYERTEFLIMPTYTTISLSW